MSFRIAITGGIGSGKSMVSRVLEILDVPVYIADDESKRLTHRDPVIREGLISLLGKDVYNHDGSLNRELLASYLFASSAHIQQINQLIHPRVRTHFQDWVVGKACKPFVGLESAILYEAGFEKEVDFVVMVYAPLEVRVERAILRDQASREQVLKRIQSQMRDEEKLEKADYIIYNDGERALIPQVLDLIAFLSKKYDYLCSAKK